MGKLLQEFENWLFENEDMSLYELVYEGAIEYYNMCNYNNYDDFYKPSEIKKEINDMFDEYLEQANVMEIMERFCNNKNCDVSELIYVIENIKGEELKKQLKKDAKIIAVESINDED